MPRNLLGIGGTSRDKMASSVLDKISPGTSALMSGFFNTPSAVANMSQFIEQNIFHPSGVNLAMVGFTVVGIDNHVVGK